MKTISVQIKDDHLQTIAKTRKPMFVIAELVWNALDADASEVRVLLMKNDLGTLDTVRILDNGHGLPYDEVDTAFGNLGGSWKRPRTVKTRGEKRIIHGKYGKGRFLAFRLGRIVRWKFHDRVNGSVQEYTITGEGEHLKQFEVSDPVPAETEQPWTEVEISGIDMDFASLLKPEVRYELAEQFAPYLQKYPEVQVFYDGVSIDPSEVQEASYDIEMDSIELDEDRTVEVGLSVIEWKSNLERKIVFCDADGFALEETPPRFHAPNFHFTAYVKSDFLRELDEDGWLSAHEVHPDLSKIVQAVRNKLRDHFRHRSAGGATKLVEEWKKEGSYPYEGPSKNLIEQVEREVFDICALNVNSYLPDFTEKDANSRRFILRLMRQALESNPAALQQILKELLDLPEERQEELAQLLKRTSLAAIINAAKVVADRIDFLTVLEKLVFKYEKVLKERSELQKILSDHTWIFGEEFHLTVDDQSLREVLRTHIKCLGREPEDVEPVTTPSGSRGIIDLMLSRTIQLQRPDELQHLVVELKAPRVKIGHKEIGQIEEYAFAVAGDMRFDKQKTSWAFWVVSNDLADYGKQRAQETDRPPGLIHRAKNGSLLIWVKTWGEIIQECKGRLRFFQKHLEYSVDDEAALDRLRQTHRKYLPIQLQGDSGTPDSVSPSAA
jgi:hypothetical protein